MADIVSRAFKEGKYSFAFNNIITYYNYHFPLPQNESWRECYITTEWVLWVITYLHGKQLKMVWLQRLPKIAKNTGIIGVTTRISSTLIISYPTSLACSNVMSSLHHSLISSGRANMEKILQDLFQPKTSTFSTRALILVHHKIVH